MPASAGSWTIERRRGSAAAFHAREVPDPPSRAVWIHDVEAPALVLGSTQDAGIVDPVSGVEIVRRRSGGGAVLLMPGDVVWVDVIVPAGDVLWDDDVGRSTWAIGGAWAAAVGPGAEVHRGGLVTTRWSRLVCFAGLGPGEVTVGGRKLVGISQRRTRGAARFQCALHTRWDPGALAAVLRLGDAERAELVGYLRAAVATVPATALDGVLAAFVAHLDAA